MGVRHPNIAWLLVDSIRHYAGGDYRGKLPFMERFGADAVEFETCVTTAPSTIMSITAMMTGFPAYFLARNYDDFRFDRGFHHALGPILKANGYSCHAFLRGQETREKFGPFLDMVPRKYWPEGVRHGTKWRNIDLVRLLERRLEEPVARPAFFFFHFNPRTEAETDPAVSDKVDTAWRLLNDAGFTPENTIFVLCSDHGYPDPRTGITTEWEVKHRLTHDVVLTDDNILIPLYIRYPGCRPGKRSTPVSTMDLFPTLLDLADIPGRTQITEEIDGTSLVPLLENGDGAPYPREFFRCDSRLMLQTGRSTAIRGSRFKYIRFHDEYRFATGAVRETEPEVLLDLEADPEESRNLLAEPGALSDEAEEALGRLRRELEATERRGLEFQVEYLLSRQRKALLGGRDRDEDEPLRVLVAVEPETADYTRIGVEAISRLHRTARIDVLAGEGEVADDITERVEHTLSYRVGPEGAIGIDGSEVGWGANGNGRLTGDYDLSVLFVQDPSTSVASRLREVVEDLPASRRLVVDCNFNAYRCDRYWYYRLRALLERVPYMIEEPRLILDQLLTGVKVLRRRFLRRFGLWERWEGMSASEGEE